MCRIYVTNASTIETGVIHERDLVQIFEQFRHANILATQHANILEMWHANISGYTNVFGWHRNIFGMQMF